MDPFITSKVVSFILTKLNVENKVNGNYNKELNSLLERGENHLKSNHIRRFSREAKGEVTAYVDPSYGSTKLKEPKLKSYVVNIIFNPSEGPLSAHCMCPVGNFMCSHIVAVLLFAQKMLSRIDFPSVWNRQNLGTNDGNKSIEDLWRTGVDAETTLKKKVTLDCLSTLGHFIDRKQHYGLHWLLSKPEQALPIKSHQFFWDFIIHSNDFGMSPDKQGYNLSNLQISDQDIEDIALNTIGQSSNSLWLKIRKNKLTASNFGAVIKVMQRQTNCSSYNMPDSLFHQMQSNYNLHNVKSISYGIQHEKDGIDYYEKCRQIPVRSSGIHFLKCGYLGGSPDGLIGESKLIEVKCPFSLREKSFEEALQNSNCCIYRNHLGELKLKEDHNYYHQIQGCLHITKRSSCDLVYWTQKWQAIIEVQLDVEWAKNLYLLDIFYKDIYLPFLISKEERVTGYGKLIGNCITGTIICVILVKLHLSQCVGLQASPIPPC